MTPEKDDLRKQVEGLTGGEAGERPQPRPDSTREAVEERMREEAERRDREDQRGDEPEQEEKP